MFKHLLFLGLASSLVTTITFAQPRPRSTTAKPVTKIPAAPKPDILVRRDGTQLEVLVTEITDNEIVYKRFNNPNGPAFRSKKSDFNYLQYGANGEIEQFTKVVQPAPAPAQPLPTVVQPQPAPTPAPRTQYAPTPVSQPRQADIPQGVRFGFKGGIQSASQSGNFFSLNNYSTKGILGFQAGLLLDVPLGTSLGLRPQLMYSGKGCMVGTSASLKVNYLEIPVDVLYKIPTSSGQFLLGGGAYFGYAMGGKFGSRDAKIGNAQNDDFTTADFGLRFSTWYDLSSGLTLNAFFNLGLSDINPTIDLPKETIKNRTFGIGVGYFLSR
ncbi:porin family protein [Spirosoma panaciterrae]|uniref:porin family protein n=1 Tax=Spirosoma panaciterrae TaxID=496058 RepID=UPI000370E859|nr:porin family protein [Spirosoma panaciterrae]